MTFYFPDRRDWQVRVFVFSVDRNVPKYLHSQELSQNILIKTAQVSVRTHNTVTSAYVDKLKAW